MDVNINFVLEGYKEVVGDLTQRLVLAEAFVRQLREENQSLRVLIDQKTEEVRGNGKKTSTNTEEVTASNKER